MKLRFIYPDKWEKFEKTESIVEKISNQFPNLINKTEISTKQFPVINPDIDMMERKFVENVSIDWGKEIILTAFPGPFYWLDMRIDCFARAFEPTGMNHEPISISPKLGGYYLLHNLKKEKRDSQFLSKIGIEEILHGFCIPREHDKTCFYHPRESLKKEDDKKDFCEKCKSFMVELKDPLNFPKIYERIKEIY